jgi:N-acetylglucosamine kinase-like BadF-type ATPase
VSVREHPIGRSISEASRLRARDRRDPFLAVGVDAGGTTVRVEVWRGLRRARRAELGAVDVAALPGLLRRVWKRWGLGPARVGGLVVASRGIWTAAERRRLEAKLRGLARCVRATSDAQAAHLGALDGQAGVLLLAGTGSIVIGRGISGPWRRAGGLGPLLGDEGSAFWIGREWLRTGTGAPHLALRTIARGPSPVARIAALAPLVLARARRGDPRAARIVREAQRHLARQAREVARQLALRPPIAASWAGSLLARSAWFRRGLRREVARALGPTRWVAPREPGVRAAARLAGRLLAGPRA